MFSNINIYIIIIINNYYKQIIQVIFIIRFAFNNSLILQVQHKLDKINELTTIMIYIFHEIDVLIVYILITLYYKVDQ